MTSGYEDHTRLIEGFARVEAQLGQNSKQLAHMEGHLDDALARLRVVETSTSEIKAGLHVGKWTVGVLVTIGLAVLAMITGMGKA